jgi:hypothetical protein
MDPLSFEIQIKDKVTSKITEIKESLKSLKDYSIEVKLDSSQLAKIEALTTKLDSLQKAMSDSSGAKSSTKDYTDLLAVLERIEKALNSISTGGIGKFGDTLATSMQSALDVMTKLTTELERIDGKFAKAMGTAMGRSLGKELKKEAKDASEAAQQLARDESVLSNALATTEQKAKSLSSALNILNGGGPGGGGGGEGGFVLRNIKSWHDAGSMLADIEKRITDIKSTMAAGQDLNNGFDTGRLQQFLDYYEKIAGYLKMIREGQGLAVVEGHGVVDTNQVKWHGDYAGNVKLYDQEVDAIKKVITETERLQTLRQQMTSLSQGVNNPDHAQEVLGMIKQIDAVLDRIKSSSQTEAASLFNKSYQDNVRNYEKRVSAIAKEQKDIAESAKQAVKAQNDLDTKIGRIQGKIDLAGTVENFNPQSIEHAKGIIRILEEAKEKIEALKYSGKELSEFLKSFDSNNITAQTINKLQSEIQVQKAENLNKYRADRKALTEQNQLNKSVQDAAAKYKDIQALLKEIDDQTSKAKALGLDTSGLDEAKTKLEKIRDLLDEISKQEGDKKQGMTADGRMFKDLKPDIKEATASQSQAIKASEQAVKDKEKADNQAREAEKKLGDQMDKTTQSAQKQSGALSGLKNMMGRYLSVYAASRFATEMANITGELELQKRSLEVIVGNASTANDLYGEIRDMSQMSPYTFQDLMKSTRQLSAFGIETKDLYSTMKALSDIGAGLSVDVQRLILAYGHTRSYGYLSGIQNRQFETAGIDMIGGLADRYNRLADAEERAGRAAEHVTRKDIFKKMSKRDISFEDVNAVIMELDQEGGKFYNMQEKQYETLGGKLRNLRNNYNIMMSEMGEQNKGVLMTGVNLLNELTGNWQKYSKVITSLLVPLGMFKLALMAVNAMQTQQNVTLTTFTNTTLRQYGQGMTSAAKSIGSSLKGLVTSAGTWITAAIAAITALVTHYVSMAREAKRVAHSLAEEAERDSSEIARVMSKYNGNAFTTTANKQYINGHEVVFNDIQFDREQMKMLNLSYELDELKRKLQSMSPFYDGDLVDIYKLETQEEQFEAIIRKMESYRLANDILEANEKTIARGARGGSPFRESFLTNLNDYADALDGISDRMEQLRSKGVLSEDTIKDFNKELGGVITGNTMGMKMESLKNYLISTLSMTDEDRRTLYKSWSEELQKFYVEALNLYKDIDFALAPDASNEIQGRGVINLGKKSAISSYADILKNLDRMADKYRGFVESVGDNDDARMSIIMQAFNRFRSEASLTEQQAKPLLDYFISLFGDSDEASMKIKQMAKDFTDQFSKAMQEAASNNKNWTADEAFDAAKKIVEDQASEWKKAGKDISTFYTQGFKEGLQNSAREMVEIRSPWQQLLQGATKKDNGDWGYSDFYNQFRARIQQASVTDSLGSFMGETMKKEFDETAKELSNDLKPLKVKWQLDIDPDIEIKSSNLNQLKAMRDKIAERLNSLPEYVADPAQREALTTALKNLNAEIITIETGNELGFKYGEDKTQTGYKADFEKRWDERIRIMKEAYDWYEKWQKQVGDTSAFEEVNSKYADVFEEWRTDSKLPFDFDATNIKDYLSYVEQIRDEALALYKQQKNDESKNNGQEALRVYRQAVAIINDARFDNFTRAAEEFKSVIDESIDNLERQWDIFSSVRQATGDEDLALRLAGLGANEDLRTSTDALRREISERLAAAGGVEVEINPYLDKRGVLEMFKNAVPEENKSQIEGLVELYERWQKAHKELFKEDVKNFTDLTAAAVSYDDQVRRIDTDLKRQHESLWRLLGSGAIDVTQMVAMRKRANTQADWQKMKLSAEYANLYNNAIAMSQDEFDNATKAIKRLLEQLREVGAITPEEYASEIERLNTANSNRIQNGFLGNHTAVGQFLGGGYEGLIEYYRTRSRKNTEEAARYKKGSPEEIQASNRAKQDKEHADNMEEFNQAIAKTIENLEKFQQGMGLIGNFFEAIGNDEVSEKFSSDGVFGQTLSGAATGFSIGGPWGAVIGGALGLITGAIMEGDKSRQEEIETNKRMIKTLESVRERLDQIKEDSLGYAQTDDKTNEIMRSEVSALRAAQEQLAQQQLAVKQGADPRVVQYGTYKDSRKYNEDTAQAMESALKSNSAYAAEYASLLMERDRQMSNLEDEKGKSNSDDDDIAEYQEKIDELNYQISQFAKNMAKELWGIDVKGWADQISDALMNAFENGENAAEAFEDAVRSIMQSVANNILKIGIIQPMMEELQQRLFGSKDKNGNWQGGAVSTQELLENPKAAATQLVKETKKYFDEKGTMLITAANEFYTGLNGALGGILTNKNEGNTLSSSMQGTTEETSGLIAGYVNAARQDLAAVRLQEAQFISVMWPDFVEEFAQQVTSLNRIDQNVLLIMEMMQYGRGAMYEKIESIDSRFRNITNGTDKVSVQ